MKDKIQYFLENFLIKNSDFKFNKIGKLNANKLVKTNLKNVLFFMVFLNDNIILHKKYVI